MQNTAYVCTTISASKLMHKDSTERFNFVIWPVGYLRVKVYLGTEEVLSPPGQLVCFDNEPLGPQHPVHPHTALYDVLAEHVGGVGVGIPRPIEGGHCVPRVGVSMGGAPIRGGLCSRHSASDTALLI